MIANSDVERFLEKRVVLTCESNVSYAGVVRGTLVVEGKKGMLLRIDAKSGFSVWCPLDFVKGLLLIPIEEEVTAG